MLYSIDFEEDDLDDDICEPSAPPCVFIEDSFEAPENFHGTLDELQSLGVGDECKSEGVC